MRKGRAGRCNSFLVNHPVVHRRQVVGRARVTQKPVILVVDGHQLSRELMVHVLASESYEIHCASDAAEALVSIERQRPLLVLSETRLPGRMSGFDLLRQLRSGAFPHPVPVVALTASVMKGSQERAMAEGFDGFLSKPIDICTVRRSVEDYLRVAPSARGSAGVGQFPPRSGGLGASRHPSRRARGVAPRRQA
jgi:CheY-like chemotaxis protein